MPKEVVSSSAKQVTIQNYYSYFRFFLLSSFPSLVSYFDNELPRRGMSCDIHLRLPNAFGIERILLEDIELERAALNQFE